MENKTHPLPEAFIEAIANALAEANIQTRVAQSLAIAAAKKLGITGKWGLTPDGRSIVEKE